VKFKLLFTDEARENLNSLSKDPSKEAAYKAVRKALGYMETNLRHTGLKTHKYSSIKGPRGEEIFESYAQNQTPGAYRIFWYYGPAKGCLSVAAIIPHP
jgi:hypothetical protein